MESRTIKFRAWDNDKKMFVPEGEIVFAFYGETRIEVVPNCLDYVGDSVHNGEPQRGRFVVQQFTGLTDKNGVDIYEGDVVKVKGTKKIGEYNTVVIYKNAGFQLKENHTYIVDNMSLVGVEIIGNIYSNPELLNQ